MTISKIAIMLTAICLLGITTPAMAQLQGTLFTSPEQRVYLDYLRADFLAKSLKQGFDIEESEIPEIPVDVVEEEVPEIYSYGGVMTRRDGSHTIWLNGKLTHEDQLPAGTSLTTVAGVMALRFNTENGVFTLKPGQTLEISAGSIMEGSPAPVLLPAPESVATSVTIATDTVSAEADNPPTQVSDEQAAGDAAGLQELQQLIQTLQSTLQGEDSEAN